MKNAFLLITNNFRQFFLIFFLEQCFVGGCRFLRCVQCPKTLNLSHQTTFGNIFKFFTIGMVRYGQKLHGVEKKNNIFFNKNISKLKNQTRKKNGTRKWVVEIVSSQVVLLDTVYYTDPFKIFFLG